MKSLKKALNKMKKLVLVLGMVALTLGMNAQKITSTLTTDVSFIEYQTAKNGTVDVNFIYTDKVEGETMDNEKLNTVRDPIKIKQCFSYIDKKLEDKFSNEEYYIKYYKHFQILNLLRIIPYCKNKTDITFLLKNIDNVWQL